MNPRAVLYSVNGTKQLFDLVNIVYTDAQGFPHTELNVALPWSKVVVLNPGVQTQSVIATSIYSQLNCSIVDAAGQPVVVSTNNSMIATCTRYVRGLSPGRVRSSAGRACAATGRRTQ